MVASLKAIGQALLTGGVGGPQATRTNRIRLILTEVLGDADAQIQSLPERPESTGSARRLLRLTGSSPHRRDAGRVAHAITNALLTRDFKSLEPLLHPSIWVMWPDGTLKRHATTAVLEHLSRHPGKPSDMLPEAVRVYTPAELRRVLARGVPEALERALETRGAWTVTMSLRGRGGRRASTLLPISPDASGQLRAHALMLPSLDEAYRRSVAPPADGDDAIRIADRVMRHLLLGHDRHLRSLRNDFLDRVWLGDEVEQAERIAEMAGGGPARLESSELVFRGTERATLADLDRAPSGSRERIVRESKAVFGRRMEKIEARVASTRFATIDADSLEPSEKHEEVFTLLIAVPGRSNEPARWRIGALLL